ncbi:hypothetical protein AB0942_33250 [Streptomyces nodosus]|uniref:hypothetical protein n=1 Tax=Streptomyces nodosus TaxID=40318 RepID=UPI00345495AC
MSGGLGGFLKNVRDGSLAIPIVGTYINDGLTWAMDDGDDVGKSSTGQAIENHFLKPGSQPVVAAMNGLNWFYDNAISQPLSTTILMGSRANEESVSHLLSASDWARAWHAANHISPGQAFMARGQEQAAQWGAPDIGPTSAQELISAKPVYATPDAAYLPEGWGDLGDDEQQDLLKQAGMPVVGNAAVEQLRRDSAFFKYSSGAADFAVRWYLDPAVLGGKALGAARSKYVVTPRPKGGWSGEDIGKLMESSRMAKVQKFLWENKDNPQLVNNLTMFQKSALGPRAGGIISKLQSPEEIGLFLRTTLGDVEARAQLQDMNTAAASRMEQDTSRLSNLELELMPRARALNSPNLEALVQRRADTLRDRIAADEDLSARYTASLDHYGELDALNLTPWSTSKAYARTSNQRLYRTGPAMGSSGQAQSALGKTRIYADDMFGQSMTVVRSFKEAHPNGMIAVDDVHQEAVDELRGHLARIPGIGPDIRTDLLNRYMKTATEGERVDLLDEVQRLGVTQIAKKHGFTHDEGMALYQEYMGGIAKGRDNLRRYSGADYMDPATGQRVNVDEFLDSGGALKVHPNMVSKLVNDQILIDLPALDKTLARNASALKALRTNMAGNLDWILNGMDHLSHLWKFATLFRLGYIPRVLGDDLMGQVARLGAASMAARTGYGVKNLATNLFHWRKASHYEGAEAVAKEGLRYADEELAALQPQADKLRARIATSHAVHKADMKKARARQRYASGKLATLDQAADPVKYAAAQKLKQNADKQYRAAQDRVQNHSPGRKAALAQLDDQLSELMSHRDMHATAAAAAKEARRRGFRQSSQLYKDVQVGDGVVLPPALAGEKGEYYMKLLGSDDSLRTLTQRNKQMIHSNLQRAYGTKVAAPVSYAVDHDMYVTAWDKAVNHQIMQDELAVQAVKGATPGQMERWLKSTPAGRAYRKRLGIKYDTDERIAQSVWHEVDEYMPAGSGIREAALNGEADSEYLAQMAENGIRPHYVHNSQLGEALAGSNSAARASDRVIDWWYKWAASIPADRMARHPLFNQLYEGHAKTLVAQEMKQGVHIAQADADRLAETARRLALRDTRKLVFDIAHRSDAGHALRFMSPFFAATTEAWQRWARIIADRPQTVGYAGMFFNAPASWGWMQDKDGNRIGRDGVAMVWDEKANRLVPKVIPKGERMIMARVPKFIAGGPIGKALGMDSSGNWLISQDSMNIVTQGDPWFNPGTGPIVSIPVNEFVKDKPKLAEVAREVGILPFGPQTGGGVLGDGVVGRGVSAAAPAYVKNFLTAFDTSDERYQRVKLQIMQQAAYEHGALGKPMPSAQEIADRTKSYWLWSAASAFTQPFATQKPDKYQFFRDQYNALRRKDPLTADEEYLKRFGESHFIFAQATSDNVGGVPATKKAVELERRYAGLISENPELAALIVGPEGNGPFSPEAYAYQLSTPLTPGGAEMQRRKLSADEAMKENQRRLGWAKFTSMTNRVTAELHSAGFTSFEDAGAERFKQMRSAIAKLYGDPLLPDGNENPTYNREWSKDYYSMDPKKYDRMIPGLTQVAFSDLAQQPKRSDLRVLQQYLDHRKALMAELARRKRAGGSATLGAKANVDLASGWARLVDGWVESNTNFGDLHTRYLARDLGVDALEMIGTEGVA